MLQIAKFAKCQVKVARSLVSLVISTGSSGSYCAISIPYTFIHRAEDRNLLTQLTHELSRNCDIFRVDMGGRCVPMAARLLVDSVYWTNDGAAGS